MSLRERDLECAKVRFPTEAEAWRRLVEIALEPAVSWPNGKRVSSYFCDGCSAWHLTRRPQ